jgi:hypothetical protein
MLAALVLEGIPHPHNHALHSVQGHSIAPVLLVGLHMRHTRSHGAQFLTYTVQSVVRCQLIRSN